MVKLKQFLYFLLNLTLISFINSKLNIPNFQCGVNNIKIEQEQVDINKKNNHVNLLQFREESDRDIPYTPIKIGFDFSSFKKPVNMTDDIYDKLKNFIIDTGKEYQKFLKVQHSDFDFAQIKNKVIERCSVPEIGDDYENYLYNYDIMIFPLFDNLAERIIAGGLSCLTLKKNDKPVIGTLYININLDLNMTNIDIFIKRFLMHELAHILGFDSSILERRGLLKQKNENEFVISSPKVLYEARKHFNCNSLEGVPFENQGGSGSAGTHWETRYMLGDYMVSTSYDEWLISNMTLALFEDLGFYKVDYNISGSLFKFGKNKGCDFFEKKCIENGKPTFDEYCSEEIPRCTSSLTNKGVCGLHKYVDDIEEEYQYFDDPKYGGLFSANYCPVTETYNPKNNFLTQNCRHGDNFQSDYGEIIGDHSFCFISSLLPISSLLSSREETAICYEVKCDKKLKQIIVNIGKQSINCPKEGGNITTTGFKGFLICPKYNDICSDDNEILCNDMFDCINAAYYKNIPFIFRDKNVLIFTISVSICLLLLVCFCIIRSYKRNNGKKLHSIFIEEKN